MFFSPRITGICTNFNYQQIRHDFLVIREIRGDMNTPRKVICLIRVILLIIEPPRITCIYSDIISQQIKQIILFPSTYRTYLLGC